MIIHKNLAFTHIYDQIFLFTYTLITYINLPSFENRFKVIIAELKNLNCNVICKL